MMKVKLRYVLGFLLLLMNTTNVFAMSGMDIMPTQQEPVQEEMTGEVISIIEDETYEFETSGGTYTIREQVLKVRILDGDRKGELVEVINSIDELLAYNLEVSEGDKVILFYSEYENAYHILEMKRDHAILWLVITFVIIMSLIGGWKGVKSLISLGITLFAIMGIFLPRVLKGENPLMLAIIISIIVTFFTLILIAGFNKKSLTALIGISFGVISAGLLALFFGRMAYLTGLSTSEAQMLLYIPQLQELDFALRFGDLLFASILLGTLGAVMDVCISIASSITEVYEANPLLKVKDLFFAGMNIGKDIMGTMSNTLILAYVGSSIHLLLLYLAYDTPVREILNQEMIATEIVRSLTGTIGLVLAIPITAIVGALLCKHTVNMKV
ncbi:putative membrane protein [Natranaerovirga hydrolytica]|uniref:Putative membrane protein n=1 Tax=Natranaerovirga hydrolytica TaxID=680378 RepID=A0A4R1MKS9_9FIRM|nr:YibE/F family protein [Natranaerovirga hydrolytica]TCK93448.1 putative membrane protein [Natranaerovirga hydrolytica]